MKKPDPEVCSLWDSIYVTFWKRQNISDRNQSSDCQGLGVRAGDGPRRGIEEHVWVMEIFFVVIMGSHNCMF